MLLFGATVGVAHSFEADHVAAVASLVDEEHGRSAGLVGTSWGVGHAVPIAAVGLVFLAVGTQLPDSVTLVAELLAGAVLVALGARVAYLGLRRSGVETTRHTHDGHDHAHLSIGSLELGTTHSHRHGESFVVGVLHGLAGSGVAIGGLATGAGAVEGVSLLAAFAVASVLSMAVLAGLWGRVLTRTRGRVLQVVAGVAAVGVGLAVLAGELLGVQLL